MLSLLIKILLQKVKKIPRVMLNSDLIKGL